MGSIRRQVNLIHYNIWRFERWWRYLFVGDRRLTTIVDQDDGELRDYFPFAFDPISGSMLPNYRGRHFSTLLFILVLSIWNFVCGIFGLYFPGPWYWGAIVSGIIAFVADLYLIPKRYILRAEFKMFESMPATKKRVSGFLTFLFVIGAWAVFFLGFWFYLRVLIAAK